MGAAAGLDDLAPFPPCTALSLLSLTLSLSLHPAGDHSLSIMLVQPVAWEGPWGGDVVWGPPDRGGRGGAGVRRTAEPFTNSLGAAVRGASRTQMPETTLVLSGAGVTWWDLDRVCAGRGQPEAGRFPREF